MRVIFFLLRFCYCGILLSRGNAMRQLELFSAGELCACAAKAQLKVLKSFLAGVATAEEVNFSVSMSTQFISYAHTNMCVFAK